MEIKCPICGTKIELEDKLCVGCGSNLNDIHQALLRKKKASKSEEYNGYSIEELDSMFEFEPYSKGYALREYLGLDSVVFVPSRYNGKSVVAISPNCFEGSDISEIYLPKSVKEIGNYAFSGCFGLNKVVLTDQIKKIGDSAFADCISLEKINFYDSLLQLGEKAFSGCVRLTKIKFSNKIEVLGEYCFDSCSSLEEIVLPENLKRINAYAFLDCVKLKKVKFNQELSSIGDYAFSGCTSLKSVLLSENIVSLGEAVFYNSTSLKSVYIGEKLNSLDGNVFYGCDSLETFRINENNKRLTTNGNSIIDKTTKALLAGCKTTRIDNNINIIKKNSFCGYSTIDKIFIPDCVISIDKEAFFNNSNLLICTSHKQKPKGWNQNWVVGDSKVIWDCNL